MTEETAISRKTRNHDNYFTERIPKEVISEWTEFQPGSTSSSSQSKPAKARLTADPAVEEPAVRLRPTADTPAEEPARLQGTETTDDSAVPLHIQQMLGILKEWGMVETMPSPPSYFFDEPRFPAFGALLREPWTEEPDNIGAFDTDLERAFTRSLGEAIERSCQSHPRKGFESAVRGTYYDLRERALDPAPFFPFSNDANLVKGIREKEFLWTPSVHYQSRTEKLLPMRLSYLHGCEPDEKLDSIRTTNGTAMWSSLEGAVFRGLCELIERDAFFIHYLGKVTPPQIKIRTFTKEIQSLISYIEKYRLEVNLFDISLEFGLPVILCIIIDRTGIGPAIAIGTNSTRGVDDAVRGALLEAVQIRHFSRRIHLEEKVGNIVGFFEKRALKWYRLESLELLDFIFSSDEYSNPKDYSGTEEDFLDSFLHDLYYSDVTLPGMKGYKVVKVNVPDLLPLYFSDEHKPIFGKRVQGYLGGQPINDVPHPFL